MRRGIDISKHQGNINFDSIKKAGVEFIILRGGFTGYGTGTSLNKDPMFESYYKSAKERNIPVGCYYYSCANTYEKGVREAEFLYEKCLKGKQFEYPIYIDVEEDRHQRIGKARVTEAIKGFCEYLELKGYYVGVYANMYYFNTYIDTPKLSKYDKWVAKWGITKPNFPYGSFGLWQNSDNGRVAGKRVDTNISYYDYPNIIKKHKLNGYGELPKQKSNEEIAKEVIKGLWGNGRDRINKLTNAGYNYRDVQNIVNSMLR